MTERTQKQSHISAVRQHLLDTLAALRDKENPMDIARAKAVAEVAGALIESAKVEVDYLRVTKQDYAPFLECPPDTSAPQLPNGGSPFPPSTSVFPGDRPGITSVTRHRLQG